MTEMSLTEQDLDRERAAALVLKDLSDEPWEGAAYWYEGAPDWLSTAELPCWDVRTVLQDRLFGAPPAPHGWREIACYGPLGKRECPWCGNEEGCSDCVLCDGDRLIYWGEGWYEVVYKPSDVKVTDWQVSRRAGWSETLDKTGGTYAYRGDYKSGGR